MFARKNDRVLVQGVTGKEGMYWLERMLQYGTNVVAGVTPGKGGDTALGVPVYDTVQAAVERGGVDVSVQFVPPLLAKEATFEAIEAGIKRIIVLADGVPVHDSMLMLAKARHQGAHILGPNCPGVVVPGETMVGILPCWLPHVFKPGTVGVVSRSGSLGTAICYQVVKAGFGQSEVIGIGGDPVVGTTTLDALRFYARDEKTRAVVMVGELGGTMEEDAAAFVPELGKPVIALIAGRMAPQGKRMGHAGAIIQGDRGSARSKIELLEASGAAVARTPDEVGVLLRRAMVG
ncbi:MAG: succinate--CoA ligase subunit alpha [Chloroflexi bacterium]|nr:succinate--CoA ligase subunit alpha [Chloroflexota bacterium]